MEFIEYPKCSTCKQIKNTLTEKGATFTERHIVEQNPTATELKKWHEIKGTEIKKFINTSGLKYKELGLKDKLPTMTNDEIYALLATDGMLVKRPLLIMENEVLIGREIEKM